MVGLAVGHAEMGENSEYRHGPNSRMGCAMAWLYYFLYRTAVMISWVYRSATSSVLGINVRMEFTPINKVLAVCFWCHVMCGPGANKVFGLC